jgi:hypothetical protein
VAVAAHIVSGISGPGTSAPLPYLFTLPPQHCCLCMLSHCATYCWPHAATCTWPVPWLPGFSVWRHSVGKPMSANALGRFPDASSKELFVIQRLTKPSVPRITLMMHGQPLLLLCTAAACRILLCLGNPDPSDSSYPCLMHVPSVCMIFNNRRVLIRLGTTGAKATTASIQSTRITRMQ